MDEDILEEVSRHDTAFEADALMDLDTEEEADRPATADRETEVCRQTDRQTEVGGLYRYIYRGYNTGVCCELRAAHQEISNVVDQLMTNTTPPPLTEQITRVMT